MKKITILLAVSIAVPLAAMAQFNSSGENGVPVDKVADALKAPDETAVVLTGNIVERIRYGNRCRLGQILPFVLGQ
jgi:uncharacterized protein YdeI (BOF family)